MATPDARIRDAARRLVRDTATLRFGLPVTHVYNPLTYARAPHDAFVRAYGSTARRVVFLGMNPGPFGMVQTGVPFGDVPSVRDWLRISGRVGTPDRQHPRRPVQGFACPRREVSGSRLWGAVALHFGSPERFFADHFVANYCPLVFIEASGRNRTPDKLPAAEREPLFEACDRHLRRLVEILAPTWVVAIGAFADTRARAALGEGTVQFARIPHPSPANPRSQKDWAGSAQRALREQGVCTFDRRRNAARGGVKR